MGKRFGDNPKRYSISLFDIVTFVLLGILIGLGLSETF